MNKQNSIPYIKRNVDRLIVNLCPSLVEQSKSINLECVLDFNEYGEVIGIEIIDLKYYAGDKVLDGRKWASINKKEGVRISYDEESDAFYLSISDEKSVEQRSVNGKLILDKKGYMVKLEVDLN